jgi:hypothetical protein
MDPNHTDLPWKFPGLWVLKTSILKSKKHCGKHPVTMKQPQNKLTTLQSNCGQYSAKPRMFPYPKSFLYLYTIFTSKHQLSIQASINYQFHLHPHFPKPFFSVPTPNKFLCSRLLAWISEATHLTPQALHFLQRSFNLQLKFTEKHVLIA